MNKDNPAASNDRPHHRDDGSDNTVWSLRTGGTPVADGGATFDRFLVPFELPEAEPVPPALTEWFRDSHVVVLGYYPVPSQTPPGLIRRRASEDAQAELARLHESLEQHAASVETRLVFGREQAETIDRVAREESCGVKLVSAPVEEIERVLVPLRNMDQVHLFAGLLARTEAQITLFHVAEGDAERASVESKLKTAQHQLEEACSATVATAVGTGRHREAIVETAELYDLAVMGETAAGLATRIFGPLPGRVVEQADTPVFVVRSD